MSEVKRPSFQFYPADYLGDLKVRVMNHEERGIYWDLVCLMWSERGELPNDTALLADAIGLEPERFAAAWRKVGRCFYESEDGETIRHKRLDAERAKQDEHRERQSEKSRKRWDAVKTTPAPEAPAAEKAPAKKKEREEPEGFELAYKALPRRAGGHNRHDAAKAYAARLREGVLPETMLEGARHYAAFIRATGKEGSEYVKAAATFFGPAKHFLEPWDLPTRSSSGAVVDERAVRWLEVAKKYRLHVPDYPNDRLFSRFEAMAASGELDIPFERLKAQVRAVNLAKLVSSGLSGDKLVAEVARRLAEVPE